MPISLDQLVKTLEEGGLVARGKLDFFLPPKATPKDAQELIRELVRAHLLTKYQAQEVYLGRARSLILGNYTILDRIGAGGMGQVFKAQHRRMERLVAVKMLPPRLTKDATALARFDREVKAAARLRHPNIVAADDADEANGVHFLVMEYVEGNDLAAQVKKHGPLAVAEAIQCILQAARGLEFAHGEGVIHRDIKPANLLLDKKGTVKILDMGLARIRPDGNAATQAELTGTGAVMGTIDYMAPEQALSTKSADARADIYSLGCTLYFLLTGLPLYDGETLTARLLAHANSPIPSLSAACPEASPELDQIVQRMVAKNVADRYSTLSEVIADLQCYGTRVPSGASAAVLPAGSSTDAELLTFLKDVSTSNDPRSKPTVQRQGTTRQSAVAGQARHRNRTSTRIALQKMWALAGGAGLLLLVLSTALYFSLRDQFGPRGEGNSADPSKPDVAVARQADSDTESRPFLPQFNGQLGAPLPEALPGPPSPEWFQKVAAMSAEEQIWEVVAELKRRNPEFNESEVHRIENGVVWDFSLDTPGVTNISPLRAFTQLQNLSLRHPANPNNYDLPISDLSPLAGMKLQSLNAAGTAVQDLSPLRDMPLKALYLRGATVVDLEGIRGMRTLEVLDFMQTQVKDIGPLAGMPLSVVACSSGMADLAPLKEAPLTSLDCSTLASTAILNGAILEDLYCKDPPRPEDMPLLLRFPRLRSVYLPIDPRPHAEILCSIKTLQTFNGIPLAEALKAPDP